MIVHDKGHLYSLDCYSPIDDGRVDSIGVPLQFVKKIGVKFPGNSAPAAFGTNCQEVIRALINRVMYLEGQIPCVENKSIGYHLRRALFAFELRAAERKSVKLPEDISMDDIELWPHCPSCGHIYIHDFNNCRANKTSNQENIPPVR